LRTTAGSALALLIAAAFAAAPADAAVLRAPGDIAAREVLAVTATGLTAGERYAVFVVSPNALGFDCYGRLARRVPRAGEPTVFSGVVPGVLGCDVPDEGTAQDPSPTPPRPPSPFFKLVEPGAGYRLVVCVPEGDRCRLVPADRTRVRVVPTGRRCEPVAFTPQSDAGASHIRARNVGCRVARDVARAAEGGDLDYRHAGLRCRGVVDDAGLARRIYRCMRPGARVTFAAA
jgi:hypothetical protein